MGQAITCTCNSCNYWVLTSGDHDVGMKAVTDHYICYPRNETVGLQTGEQGFRYNQEVPPANRSGLESDTDFYVCSEFSSDTDLVVWDTDMKPCPRCDDQMVLHTDMEMIMWE